MSSPETPAHPPQWKPLSATDRRVIGVLVEKAKTTPEAYPLTLNGLVTGSNQKNNRDPHTNLDADDVEESIARLRAAGALIEVQGSGRVSKYRHLMYDWLGVNKVELGVMTELLLRGAQTEGELRGRAARMDPIPDLDALRPVLQSLKAKGLLVSLTAEGRGHILTHALYLPQEMASLRAKIGEGPPSESASRASSPAADRPAAAPAAVASHGASQKPATAQESPSAPFQLVTREIEQFRDLVGQLRTEIDDLTDRLQRNEDGLREIKDALGS